MIGGYLLYRFGGEYRVKVGGGGPGLSGPPPENLVTTGIYAYTRNPMYSGHVLSLFGTAILTSSPLALAFAVANLPWFDER